jgi:hypothetical protein
VDDVLKEYLDKDSEVDLERDLEKWLNLEQQIACKESFEEKEGDDLPPTGVKDC